MEKQNELYETVEKIAKASVLLYAVMESDGDLIEEPCVVNKRKYDGFHKAISILCDLKAKGKCDFEAMDIRKEYTMHSIEVKWNFPCEFTAFCLIPYNVFTQNDTSDFRIDKLSRNLHFRF